MLWYSGQIKLIDSSCSGGNKRKAILSKQSVFEMLYALLPSWLGFDGLIYGWYSFHSQQMKTLCAGPATEKHWRMRLGNSGHCFDLRTHHYNTWETGSNFLCCWGDNCSHLYLTVIGQSANLLWGTSSWALGVSKSLSKGLVDKVLEYSNSPYAL